MIRGRWNEFGWISLSGIGLSGVSVAGFSLLNVFGAPEPLGDVVAPGVDVAGEVVGPRYGVPVLGVPQELQPLLGVEYVPTVELHPHPLPQVEPHPTLHGLAHDVHGLDQTMR